MEIRIKNRELFKKILNINYPFMPEIYSFSFDGEGIIEFEERKRFSEKEKKIIEAGYSKYGLFFSSSDLIFPDIIDEPKEIRIQNSGCFNLFFWENIFPKNFKEYLSKELFLFIPDKGIRGFTSIAKYFYIEEMLGGKNVFYLNFKDCDENFYENFLLNIKNKNYNFFIFDHIGLANQEVFEKFLFFILKAPMENYEVVSTQWPSRILPEGKFLDVPSFSFSEILKIFHFPELKKEEQLNLLEEYVSRYGYFPSNLVSKFLEKIGVKKEEKEEKRSFQIPFDEEKVKNDLKKGKLFNAYAYFEEIKKSKELYPYLLAWQGDGETLLSILEKSKAEEIKEVLFFLIWDGFLDLERARDLISDEIYFLLKERKKDFLRSIEKIINKRDKITYYLKLIYADKLITSGKIKEGEKIFQEILNEKKTFNDFQLAQFNRFFSYYNFYKEKKEEAIENIKKWIEISSKNGWLWQMPLAYNDLGAVYTELKDFENARKSFLSALNFSFFISEEKKENVTLFNLGVIYSYKEEFSKAEEIFKKLEKIHREKDDYYSLVFDLYEISKINYLLGDIEKSLKYLSEINLYFKEIKNHPRFFQVLLLYAKVSIWDSLEKYKKALELLKKYENFPVHLDKERKILLSQGAIRGIVNFEVVKSADIEFELNIKNEKIEEICFEIKTIEDAIKIAELNLFYKEKLAKNLFEKAISYFEKKGLSKWKNRFSANEFLKSIQIFEIFKDKEIDLKKIPFPFRIELEDGLIIENGRIDEFSELSIGENISLCIPKDLLDSYPEEFWYVWTYALIYKLKDKKEIFEKIPDGLENFNGFYYSSYKMKKIVEKAKKLAKSDVPIHIFGETGTGKEILAKAIHQESKRFFGPFVPVNCSAIPENLFESEFFGWKKGAFTGALMDRPGYFEQADKGTLFLDEIGELPLNLQAKLLRVLQEKEIQRLGDFKRKNVDFRLISATNKDLKKEVEKGSFREDLYYRIMVGSIYLPPLRERKEEISTLAKLLISLNLKNFGIKNFKIDPLFFKFLEKREWKGNVRELENYIISLLANLEEGGILSLEKDFHQKKEEIQKLKGNYHKILNDFKRELIEEALKKAGNNRKQAAKLLGITPQALGYILRELKMVK